MRRPARRALLLVLKLLLLAQVRKQNLTTVELHTDVVREFAEKAVCRPWRVNFTRPQAGYTVLRAGCIFARQWLRDFDPDF